MDLLDQTLFSWFAAGYQANPPLLVLSRLIATYAIGAVPIILAAIWIRRPEKLGTVLNAILAGVIGLIVAEALSTWTGRSRPFMIGLSPIYLPHAAEGSFPSAHASVMLAVSFSLLRSQRTRVAGWTLLALGLITGWARVYTGLHFPLDIAGAAVLAAAIVWSLGADGPRWIAALARRFDHFCAAMAGRWRSEDCVGRRPANRE